MRYSNDMVHYMLKAELVILTDKCNKHQKCDIFMRYYNDMFRYVLKAKFAMLIS